MRVLDVANEMSDQSLGYGGNVFEIDEWRPSNIVGEVCDIEMQKRHKSDEEQLLYRVEVWIDLSRVVQPATKRQTSEDSCHLSTKLSSKEQRRIDEKAKIQQRAKNAKSLSSLAALNGLFKETPLKRRNSLSDIRESESFEEDSEKDLIVKKNPRWKLFSFKNKDYRRDAKPVQSDQVKRRHFKKKAPLEDAYNPPNKVMMNRLRDSGLSSSQVHLPSNTPLEYTQRIILL